MVKLYLKNWEHVTPTDISSWCNFCLHVHGLMEINHSDLSGNVYQLAWQKLRDQQLHEWHAVLSHQSMLRMPYKRYLEFPDAESLMAFVLAWS